MGEDPDIVSNTSQHEEAAWRYFAAVVLNYDLSGEDVNYSATIRLITQNNRCYRIKNRRSEY